MLSKELKKRLAKLNRAAIRMGPGASPAKSQVELPEALPTILAPDLAANRSIQGLLPIEEVAPGRVVERPNGGTYWLIERRLREIASNCETFARRYGDLLMSEAVILPEGTYRRLAQFAECNPCRVLYLDIETTGLSGSPLFLVGVMEFDGEDFVIKQYFARHYAEEPHLLADVADVLPTFEMLVTFNGRSFDVPYVRDRATVHRLALQWPRHHLDLLPVSRRHWSQRLPNCKLSTLEQHICLRRRVDDIPGALIPAAYHEFVHTNDASKMRHVIHHNALDLVTMAELALFMLTGRKDWD
jgi:uncharacterized protein YprB with RNaseH-like and TPR domain